MSSPMEFRLHGSIQREIDQWHFYVYCCGRSVLPAFLFLTTTLEVLNH